MTILAVDIGTTALKTGIFRSCGDELVKVADTSSEIAIRTYGDGAFSEVDPAEWQRAFTRDCGRLRQWLGEVEMVSISGTTPGLTAMDEEGRALHPSILMLDQRSHRQAAEIVQRIGRETLLETTGNLPVAGGCSLASILWIRDERPDVYRRTRIFGHSNTFFARWLTGAFAIDPSSASLTALYNTARNDLTWNDDIARAFGFDVRRLPKLMRADRSAGRIRPALAAELGLTREPHVLIGGNDAVLAAYSLGIEEPGDIINVNGTCEITLVCLPRCLASPTYNVRAHVIPDRWLTLHVMNAGGTALEWFRTAFCGEMTAGDFYGRQLPAALAEWIGRRSGVSYVPYLMGSRYSLKPLKAEFRGLTRETTREEMLAALVRSLCRYQRRHLLEVGRAVPLSPITHITGGAVNDAVIRAKKAWFRDGDYRHQEQSSLFGAARLALNALRDRTKGSHSSE